MEDDLMRRVAELFRLAAEDDSLERAEDDSLERLKVGLDEDEVAAKAADRGSWAINVMLRRRPGFIMDQTAYDTDHIVRQDPARTLREVAAKREILAMHMPRPFWSNNPPPLQDRTYAGTVEWCCDCQCPDGVIQGTYPCETVRAFAAIYSDDAT